MNRSVQVSAPARLHMGFLDLSGSLGRQYGSVGVALKEIQTCLTLQASDRSSANGPCAERALACAHKLATRLQVPDRFHIEIESAIPEHVGLGSGTQLSLAIGLAISKLYDLGLSVREVAQLTRRGVRSGIGIAAFEQGGFILDGGCGDETLPAPVISRMTIPDHWRFLLVFDQREQGFHDQQELSAFSSLPPFPQHQAAHLCHLVLMQAMPSLAEQNITAFGDIITQLQQAIGDYFAPAQGGRFTSTDVAEAIHWLGQHDAVALGQSSWGPTGFCLIEGIQQSETILQASIDHFKHLPHLHFKRVSAQNHGGSIRVSEAVLAGSADIHVA